MKSSWWQMYRKRGGTWLFLPVLLLLSNCGRRGLPASAVHHVLKKRPPAKAPKIVNLPPGQRKCWVFTHLQKAGGTTVKKIMVDRWSNRRAIFDSPEWKAGDRYGRDFAQRLLKGVQWDAIAGGYTEALRSTLGDTCKWFTVFRHPITRLLSAYYYCRKIPGDWLCASKMVRASEVDIVEFARHWGNFALRQFALNFVRADDVVHFVKRGGVQWEEDDPLKLPAWYLLKQYLDYKGNMAGGNEETMLLEMMNPVRDLIHDNFTAVGILEDFEGTMGLFNAALKVPRLNWKIASRRTGERNVNNAFHEEKDVALQDAWINTEIRKYISLDILLYEHAVEVFREQAQVYGLA